MFGIPVSSVPQGILTLTLWSPVVFVAAAAPSSAGEQSWVDST